VLYGGAAGGGKSDALLVDAASLVGQGYGRNYKALVLRRTYAELELSLIIRSHELYPRLGGVYKASEHYWQFPRGERIYFSHLEHTQSVHRYQSSEFQRVLFDELTSFTESQYLYLFSRVRSAHKVPCAIRSATNPGGVGHEWVKQRWYPWVSKRCERPALPGKARFYFGANEEVPHTAHGAISRTFIPALLEDNPYLDVGDPQYRSNLRQMGVLENEQLEFGNWDAEPASKDYWDRERIQVLKGRPNDATIRVRSWDIASTPKGDYTVGTLCSSSFTRPLVIEHVIRFRGTPEQVMQRFGEVLKEDSVRHDMVITTIPQDPGAAGKFVVSDFQRAFPGHAIYAIRPSKDKVVRFRPVSARALAGNVAVVDDGSWSVSALHNECEAFPLGTYDDQVDTLSDAYASLMAPSRNGTESYV